VGEINDNDITRLLADPKTQRQAFTQVVRQYSEPLYWKICRMVLSHDDANDVLQNTFVKAWTNIGSFQNKSKFSTWLYRIAMNESLDFLRRQKTAGKVSTDDDQGVANRLLADEYFDGDQTEAELQQAIAQLPDVQRMVFNLRYFEEMPYAEMSQLLNTSEGALKASYHLAVKKVSEYFKSHD
jgi:RNA polymerase sigma-70 factor (ECF subfamily)